MYTENYKNSTINVIGFKTEPGWNMKWQVVKNIANGEKTLGAGQLSIIQECAEDDAVMLAVQDAQNYINKNC